MKKQLAALALSLCMFGGSLQAQKKGEVTTDMLKEIRGSYSLDDQSTRAMSNALSNNDIKNIALNRELTNKTDHYFKYKVDVKGITNQKSSGRCWMFTSMNVLRPKVMNKYNLGKFEFSQNYLYFWDIFEKSNLFLEIVINNREKPMNDRMVEWAFKSPIGDGGVWNSFVNLAEKYGSVPKSVMPETHNSQNTGWMRKLIRRKLREQGLQIRKMAEDKKSLKEIRKQKVKMLSKIYRMLALNLGEPPTEFEWRFKDKSGKLSEAKKYTPKSFYKEVLPQVKLDDYILLMNDPTREYYKLYEIEYDRNVMEGRNWKYINLPVDKIKEFALSSIKANEAMYASCDVGKQINGDEGLLSIDNYDFEAVYGLKFGMNKKERVSTFESGSSHGMALVAVDVDKNEKPTKWQFENSWGSARGHNGYLTFTDEWFSEYMFRVVVLRKFLDAKTLNVLKQKTIMLPPWDPMFSEDK